MKKIFWLLPLLSISPIAEARASIDARVQQFLDRSLPRLACNLNVGRPGSIIASPEAENPNYYFHWVRDSALVADALTKLIPFVEGTKTEAFLHGFLGDFTRYSERLQRSPTPNGFGEVRFNPDGSVDSSEWPRPQFDGPALRALTLLNYLDHFGVSLAPEKLVRLRNVIRRDLDAVAALYDKKGFDLWEYSNGFHFYTRLVQLAALRKGLAHARRSAWSKAETDLATQISRHWSAEKGVFRFNDGPATNDAGLPIRRSPDHFDTSVVLAVIHGSLGAGELGELDGRVWSSLRKSEEYFERGYPFNRGRSRGFAIGRHEGDEYFGGNAFFFLTAGFAEYNFRIARVLRQSRGKLVADALRRPMLSLVLGRAVAEGEEFRLPNEELARAFARNGEAYLATMFSVIPESGAVAEQFSKQDGSPVSARDLSWSYSSILTAILERENFARSKVDFTKLKFACPQ